MKKDIAQRDKAKFYGMTLLSFHTGAALSLVLYMACGIHGIWLCLIPAFLAVWLVSTDIRINSSALISNTVISSEKISVAVKCAELSCPEKQA